LRIVVTFNFISNSPYDNGDIGIITDLQQLLGRTRLPWSTNPRI